MSSFNTPLTEYGFLSSCRDCSWSPQPLVVVTKVQSLHANEHSVQVQCSYLALPKQEFQASHLLSLYNTYSRPCHYFHLLNPVFPSMPKRSRRPPRIHIFVPSSTLPLLFRNPLQLIASLVSMHTCHLQRQLSSVSLSNYIPYSFHTSDEITEQHPHPWRLSLPARIIPSPL